MRDGRQPVAHFRPHLGGHDHEGTFDRHIEIEPALLPEDRGRERTEALAMLDLGVELPDMIGAAGIGEDAAVAERARTPFGTPLPPADDRAAGEAAGAPQEMPRHHALGLGSGHRVIEKIAAIHNARFAEVPAPAGFSRCYRVVFDGAPARV